MKFLVLCFFLPDENCDDLSQTFLTDCENLKYGLEAQNQNEYFVLNVLSGVHTKKQERCNFCTFIGTKNATLGAPFWVQYCTFSKRCNFAPLGVQCCTIHGVILNHLSHQRMQFCASNGPFELKIELFQKLSSICNTKRTTEENKTESYTFPC